MKNKISPPADMPVIMTFTFDGEFATDGLSNFDEIVLVIGGETYSTVSDPDELYHLNSSELTLSIGDSTSLEKGIYLPNIRGYNIKYNDGYILNSPCFNRLGNPIIVC